MINIVSPPVRLFSTASLALLLVLTVGCGAGPKGESLLEFEALRAQNYTRTIHTELTEDMGARVQEIRGQALASIAQSDEWYEAAIDSWSNAEDDKAEELSRQGILLYRAAEAYSRAADARQRMEDANESYQNQLERRNRYNDMVAANLEVIELLTALQNLYEQTADCRAELTSLEFASESEAHALYAIQEARAQQRIAQNFRADDFSSSTYQAGVSFVTDATDSFERQSFDEANDAAMAAIETFREAVVESRSDIDDVQSDMLRSSSNQTLFDTASGLFGENAFVDGRGLVIVVTDLFSDRRSEIRADRDYILDQIAELASDSRVDVVVEGHTSDSGNRSNNLTLSRARADAVEEYLSQHDVRGSRISVENYGEDFPRFDNRTAEGRADNNRVEIILELD